MRVFGSARKKTRFYAGTVSQGPFTKGGRSVGAAGPDGLPGMGRRRGTKRHRDWRDLRRPLKFPNLIVSLTRFSHVLEGFLASRLDRGGSMFLL